MADNYKCVKEDALSDLRVNVEILNKGAIDNNRRLDKIENKVDDLSAISSAISVMSLSLEHIVEHNQRQDEMMKAQNKTLESMNSNLNRLNQGQENLEAKVGKLEIKVEQNETLNTVDLRTVNKEKQEVFLKKYAGPVAAGMAIGVILLQIITALK